MEIKGNYKLKGSINIGLKFLVIGREFVEYDDENFVYAPRYYYVGIPGKKLKKIKLENYNPLDVGVRQGGAHFLNSHKFTSYSSNPIDWELDIVHEKWDAFIDNSLVPYYPPFINYIEWQNVILNHVNGRNDGNWSEIKNINHNSIYNEYASMEALGNGIFIGTGITNMMAMNRTNYINLGITNSPLYFYSKETGLVSYNGTLNQSVTGSFDTNPETVDQVVNVNTMGFLFYYDVNRDKFEFLLDAVPKEYKLSKNATLSGEFYILNASATASNGIYNFTGNYSYLNYNAYNGLRNKKYAFVLENSVPSFSASGALDLHFWYTGEVNTRVLRIDLSSGFPETICEYKSSFTQRAYSHFYAGRARVFHDNFMSSGMIDVIEGTSSSFVISDLIGIDVDVLPKFLSTVFYSENSVLIDSNIIYNVYEIITNDGDIISESSLNKFNRVNIFEDYQIKVRKFDTNDLSSCEEFIVKVKKSEQPDIPIFEISPYTSTVVWSFKYHP